jgi:hypothetical protein
MKSPPCSKPSHPERILKRKRCEEFTRLAFGTLKRFRGVEMIKSSEAV